MSTRVEQTMSAGGYRAVVATYNRRLARGEDPGAALEGALAESRRPVYRHNFRLPEEAIEQIGDTITEAAQERLRVVDLLDRRGLSTPLLDIGVKTFTYREVSDVTPAHQGMDMRSRGVDDLADIDEQSVPVPVTQKEHEYDVRDQVASQRAIPIDMTNVRVSTRQVAEKLEDTVCNGGDVTVGGNGIPGITTQTNRNTASVSTAWDDGAKTTADAVSDVRTALAAARADSYYGPFALAVSGDWGDLLDEDYSVDSGITLLERINRFNDIEEVVVADKLTSEIVLFQLTPDVIEMPVAVGISDLPWEPDPHTTRVKVFAVMTFAVKQDYGDNSGIVHGS